MRVIYELKDNKIDSLYIETKEPFVYSLSRLDNAFMVNRANDKLSKTGILHDLKNIFERKRQGNENYQISGLSGNFLTLLEQYKITKEEILEKFNETRVLEMDLDKVIDLLDWDNELKEYVGWLNAEYGYGGVIEEHKNNGFKFTVQESDS